MPSDQNETAQPNPKQEWFATTHWSVVLAAGHKSSENAGAALEKLCRTYWYPLYVYVRRRGCDSAEAEDLTQEFFARLLQRNDLGRVHPAKGKFRSYLLASLNHFLSNQWDKKRAEKRGGKQTFISLQDENAENRYLNEPASELPPERVFDKRWALTLLDEAYGRLREGFQTQGKTKQFDLLKRFLASEGNAADYAAVGAESGMSANNVAVSVHRIRQKYRELVRTAIAQTVSNPADIDGEMKYLLEVLRQ